jgi:hypothetical protein
MKKTVVRPFEAGSLMLALVGFAFPAMLIYEAVSIILKGLAPERIVVIAVAAYIFYKRQRAQNYLHVEVHFL